MAVIYSSEVTLTDLSDAANVSLSGYAYTFPATYHATNPAAKGGTCSFSVDTRIGATQVDCSVNPENIILPSAGVSVSVAKATGSFTPVVTVTVTNSLTQSVLNTRSTITVPVQFTYQGETVTISKDFSLALSPDGQNGAAGYNYFTNADVEAIVRSEEGELSSTAITVSTTRGQTGNPSAYPAYYWSHYTTDGSTWTQISKSTSATASVTVTIPSSVYSTVKAIRVTAHTGSPTDANKVDTITIPIIDSGATGPQGEPAYTVILTNESHTFAATKDPHALASSIETSVIAYKGGTRVNATIGTVTGTVTGLTATIKSNTNDTNNPTLTIAATTSLVTQQGVLTIPVTVDGKTFTKQFSWSLSPTGSDGAQGPKGDDGLSMSITSNNGTTFRNNSGSTTLTAHIWQSGAEITGTALSTLGTIKWYKDGGSTAVGTGSTITISASDVASKAVYAAKLEG